MKNFVHNGEIKSDWRQSVNIENKDEKTRALKFGGFIEKEYKVGGNDTLEENLPFDEKKVLESFLSIIKRDFPMEIEVNNFLILDCLSRKRTKERKQGLERNFEWYHTRQSNRYLLMSLVRIFL